MTVVGLVFGVVACQGEREDCKRERKRRVSFLVMNEICCTRIEREEEKEFTKGMGLNLLHPARRKGGGVSALYLYQDGI